MSGMLFALLTLWSIVLVENVHPVNVLLEYEGCSKYLKYTFQIAQATSK